VKNLALNLSKKTKCEFNSPEMRTEEKSRPFHVPTSQVSMRRTSEFMAGSCTVSESLVKEEAGAGGERRNTTFFPQIQSQTQKKLRKLSQGKMFYENCQLLISQTSSCY